MIHISMIHPSIQGFTAYIILPFSYDFFIYYICFALGVPGMLTKVCEADKVCFLFSTFLCPMHTYGMDNNFFLLHKQVIILSKPCINRTYLTKYKTATFSIQGKL